MRCTVALFVQAGSRFISNLLQIPNPKIHQLQQSDRQQENIFTAAIFLFHIQYKYRFNEFFTFSQKPATLLYFNILKATVSVQSARLKLKKKNNNNKNKRNNRANTVPHNVYILLQETIHRLRLSAISDAKNRHH
jgi:Uncharacterized flavoproteins